MDRTFGLSVVVNGDGIVVGRGGDRVHVFDAASGARRFTIFDPFPSTGGCFGNPVPAFGGHLVVSDACFGPGPATGDVDVGIAYLFDGATGALLAIIRNPSADDEDHFAAHAAYDDTIVTRSRDWDSGRVFAHRSCSDGVLAPGETCDDGNLVIGDGCDPNCTPTACGNGIRSPDEACDDGNPWDGDGCKTNCTPNVCGDGVVHGGVEVCDAGAANGSADSCCSTSCGEQRDGFSCTDTDACTVDGVCSYGRCGTPTVCPLCEACDPAAGCVPAPKRCLSAPVFRHAPLHLERRGVDRSDRVTWRWRGAPDTGLRFLGYPDRSTDYALCIFDRSGDVPRLAFRALAPAGTACGSGWDCWRQTPAGGFVYRDRAGHHGISRLDVGPGPGRAHAFRVRAAGPDVRVPDLPISSPLLVQLQSDEAACWEASYDPAAAGTNTATRFRATPSEP